MVNFKCEASFYKTFSNQRELIKKFSDICSEIREALGNVNPIFRTFEVDLSVDKVLDGKAIKGLVAIYVDDTSSPKIVITVAIYQNVLRVHVACSILGLQWYFNKIYKAIEDFEPEVFICG